mmetsp:Transcript_52798/g.150619  ORF Transcript_52798/g.150619 Transcript_52798/m.150619 type:complete len:208 (+) Transcript_52798:228-851(+)
MPSCIKHGGRGVLGTINRSVLEYVGRQRFLCHTSWNPKRLEIGQPTTPSIEAIDRKPDVQNLVLGASVPDALWGVLRLAGRQRAGGAYSPVRAVPGDQDRVVLRGSRLGPTGQAEVEELEHDHPAHPGQFQGEVGRHPIRRAPLLPVGGAQDGGRGVGLASGQSFVEDGCLQRLSGDVWRDLPCRVTVAEPPPLPIRGWPPGARVCG